jgi:MOSC N-terminal beta barrel domain
MERIGTVETICRYPVKSMAGEEVAQAFVGFAGMMGDRAFAFVRTPGPKGFPWHTGREQEDLVLFHTRSQDEKPEHAGSEAGGGRRLIKGALAMNKVAVYIAFVLSTAWLLYGSWQPPQTVSGNHASREVTNDYWQDAPRAPMTDEGETEAKVARAEGEQLSVEE